MEYRAYITISGLSGPAHDERHDRLIEVLERDHGDFGPILGGGTAGLDVVVATDADSVALAAGELTAAVCGSLSAAALGDLYPTAIVIEPVEAMEESRADEAGPDDAAAEGDADDR